MKIKRFEIALGIVALALVVLLVVSCAKENPVEVTRIVTAEVTRVVQKVKVETVVVTATATPVPTPKPTAIPEPTIPPNAVVDIYPIPAPSSRFFLDRVNGYTIFQMPFAVANQPVVAKAINIWETGSLDITKLKNPTLYIDGKFVTRQVDNTYLDCSLDEARFNSLYENICLNGMRYEFSQVLETGSHVIKVEADIAPDAEGTFAFGLREESDFDTHGRYTVTKGNQIFGMKTFLTVGGSPFHPIITGAQILNTTGTVTTVKRFDSPSGDLDTREANILLAKYVFGATGEPIELRNLPFRLDVNTGSRITIAPGGHIRLMVDGNIYALEYLGNGKEDILIFNPPLILQLGSPVVLEVRASMGHSDGVEVGDVVQIKLMPGRSNGVGVKSGATFSIPAVGIDGNFLKVRN